MFLGEHSHSLDLKGRMILPARFREQLAMAYLTTQKAGCLALWPPDPFRVKAAEMQELQKGSEDEQWEARLFFNGATEVVPDGQGRVALPPWMRDFAGFDRDVVVSGQLDHVEVWDAARFQGEKAARGLGTGLRTRPQEVPPTN